LIQVTSKLLETAAKSGKQSDPEDFAIPPTATIEKLSEMSTAKLSEIVRRSTAKERGWTGYDDSEVEAARDLLSEESSGIVR
jgi:ER membrane protein complex subunit 2